MKLDNFINELSNQKIEYVLAEPMSRHTTFKIGGNADVLVKVKSVDELKNVLAFAKEYDLPYFVLGKGSNLLVSDKGIEGVVISLEYLNDIKIDGNTVTCGAGAGLMTLCTTVQKASLSGLEFAFGIPGTVGGALYMNAGAYGGEMSQAVVGATALDADGNIKKFDLDSMCLGYRTSVFKNTNLIILSAEFSLKNGDKQQIKAKMDDFFGRRRDKQPLEYPSAGSTFKRPEGYFAGALIEQNNLKGVSCGGAQVSEKHAGFVINTGNATAADVKNLIKHIQKTIMDSDGVELEPEVIFVGRE
ncbi:MAG: UDP-N-acetylmuramate dehydrogenase [Clostridia bacterium]|nr:UDP-N-acetylmuramate dehydrogenase [Clostridia bacterium]